MKESIVQSNRPCLLVDAVSRGKNVSGVDEGTPTELAVVPVDADDPRPLVLVSRPTASNPQLGLQFKGKPVISKDVFSLAISS